MANGAGINIISISQTTILNENLIPIAAYKIFFSVDGQGSFSLDVPQAGYSPEAVKPLIEAEAKKIRDTRNLK